MQSFKIIASRPATRGWLQGAAIEIDNKYLIVSQQNIASIQVSMMYPVIVK